MDGPLPTSLSTSGVQFNFQFAANGGAETGSFYIELYRASTSALIGTHGSSGSPSGTATTTQTTFNVSLAEVTTTDIANDLKIRVYGSESNKKPFKLELATVSGATPHQTFTLYDTS